jgi:hypothetical protein
MRLTRVRFRVRTIMAAVVVTGLMSSGYVWLIRLEPALSQASSDQRIGANGAESAYLNAKLLRKVVEIRLRETIEHSARPFGDGQRERDRLDWQRQRRLPSGFWLPYSNRLLETSDGSEEDAMQREVEKVREDEEARKLTYKREMAAAQMLAWLVKAIQVVMPPVPWAKASS